MSKYNGLSISYELINSISKDKNFNYRKCPICNNKLEVSHNDKYCKNECINIKKAVYVFSQSKLNIVLRVTIFNNDVIFSPNVDLTRNNRHFYMYYDNYVFKKKRVERLIKYYKSKDRYIMKLLIK